MKLKRLIAGVLSAAMMLSVGSTLAFADDVVYEDKGMTFTSTMLLDADTISAPNVTYTYTLAGVDAAAYTYDTDTTTYFVNSTDRLPTTTTVEVAFTTSDYNTGTGISKTAKFDFSTVTYTEPGVYVYTIKEVSDPTQAELDGLYNETNDTRYVYVTVKNTDSTGTAVAISDIIMTSEEIDAVYTDTNEVLVTESAKSNGYLHSYGLEGDDDDDDGIPDDDATSEDFIITTETKGDMANYGKEFTFAVAAVDGIDDGTVFKVTPDDGITTAYVIYDATDDAFYFTTESEIPAAGTAFTANKEKPFEFQMSSGETYTILSAAEGMAFSATVSDPAEDGYSFYNRANKATTWVPGETGSDSVDGETTTVDGINFATVRGADPGDDEDDEGIDYDKAFPETGVVLDLAPYALMIVLAGAFIAFRVVKSARRDEE